MQVATMVDGKSATDKSGQDADRQMQVSKAGVSKLFPAKPRFAPQRFARNFARKCALKQDAVTGAVTAGAG